MVYCAATGSQYQVYVKLCLTAGAGLTNPRGRQRGQDQARRWAKRALEANPPLNYLWRPPLGARAPTNEFLRLNRPKHPTHALQRTAEVTPLSGTP